MKQSIYKYIVDLFNYPTKMDFIYNNSDGIKVGYSEIARFQDWGIIVSSCRLAGIKISSIYKIFEQVDIDNFEQDIPIHFTNKNDLIRFAIIAKDFISEIMIFILHNLDNKEHYYVEIIQAKDEYINTHKKYAMKVLIDNLTFEQYKMLEIFIEKLQVNGNDGHSEDCTLFCDGDGEFRPRIIINGEEGNIDNSDNIDNMYVQPIINKKFLHGDKTKDLFKYDIFSNGKYIKTEFGVHERTYTRVYLPIYLMELFNKEYDKNGCAKE